eukprot:scaffold4935_cov229-Prasinococcus_capsulatus_cf.AAC.2
MAMKAGLPSALVRTCTNCPALLYAAAIPSLTSTSSACSPAATSCDARAQLGARPRGAIAGTRTRRIPRWR